MVARGPLGQRELLREQPGQRRQPLHRTALLARHFGPVEVLAHGEEAVWESAEALEEARLA